MKKSTKSLSGFQGFQIFIICLVVMLFSASLFDVIYSTETGCDNDDVVCVSQAYLPDASYQCKPLITKGVSYKQEWTSKRLFMFNRAVWADDTHNIIDYSGDALKLNINNLWPTAKYTCRFDISKNTVFDYKIDLIKSRP